MKKTILTLLLLFIANFATAQDASNDATWEETIDFISENLHFFDGKTCEDNKELDVHYNISNQFFKRSLDKEKFQQVNLIYLLSAEITENGITLRFEKNAVSENDRKKTSEIVIEFPSTKGCKDKIWVKEDERVKMLLKAFKRLADLSKEKRIKKNEKFKVN